MATTITLGGKTIKRPGVYALTKSGIKTPPQNLPYGNIVIIDNGLGAGFVGGAGVTGTFSEGVDSVYELTTIQQFREFTKGGPVWDLGKPLFKPSKNGYPGTSKVYLIKAATTTTAEIPFTFANGSLGFQTIDEGVNANGVLTTGRVTKGYAAKMLASSVDPTKYIFRFYHGGFTGIDTLNNLPYDGTKLADIVEDPLFTSPDVSTIQELLDWCAGSSEFKAVFKIKPGTVITTTGAFTAPDLTTNVGFKLATGGTETYDATSYDKAIAAVKNLDNTFFLSLDSGANATSLSNTKLFDFIVNDSKYEKFLMVAGGADKAHFAVNDAGNSEFASRYYNSDRVIVVHGGCKINGTNGILIKSQLYKAAVIMGRMCGLEPQTPLTLKDIDIDGEVHKLTETEQEYALDKGIVTTQYDDELSYFVIQQGINTLQRNARLVNDDGTSHDIGVKRITAQLNKEIAVAGKKAFFGSNVGPNRNTMSEVEVKAWTEGFLQKKVAGTLQDNLILRYENIQTEVKEDNYFVSYGFAPNYPISKVIFTGIILEK